MFSPLSLSTSLCLSIERLIRNFLWSAFPDKSKSNFVKWEIVCLPKNEGGLGLRRVKEFHEACKVKLG